MKLPQTIEGIQREGRTDRLVSGGVNPAWLGDVWDVVKGGVKKVSCALCRSQGCCS